MTYEEELQAIEDEMNALYDDPDNPGYYEQINIIEEYSGYFDKKIHELKKKYNKL